LVVKSIGKRRFMELARHASKTDADVQRVIDEWDGLGPFLQRQVELDSLCGVKSVDPYHFLLAVAEAELRFFNSASVFIAAFNLCRRSLRGAGAHGRRHKGSMDAVIALGVFIPAPKGAQK
jgi:hypothetical protein